MVSGIATRSKECFNPTHLLARMVLYKDELYHLPKANQRIQILSGCAWLTQAGQDFILPRGEKISLESAKDSALISALGQTPLVFEIRTEN
jgi:hypothetical protein